MYLCTWRAPIDVGGGPQLVPKVSHLALGPPSRLGPLGGGGESGRSLELPPFDPAAKVAYDLTPTPRAFPVAVLVAAGLPVRELVQLLE